MANDELRIEIYKRLSAMLGTESKVTKYYDEGEENSMHIMCVADPTNPSVNFYSTLELFQYPVIDRKYEILIAGYINYSYLPDILSTCAFFVMKDGWDCTPGTVFETLVEMYAPSLEMKHIMFIQPYLWEDKMKNFILGDSLINFVLAIPISEKELEYKNKYGVEALEILFQNNKLDILDFNRKSLV